MTTATTPTLEVAYDVSGVGAPLVLLHAGVTDRRLWDEMINTLEVAFTVYRPDLRGFGDTRATATGEWSLHQDLVDLLDALGIERAHLCGVSIGGAAALNTALESPDRVGSLILINPALYGFSGRDQASVRIDKEIDDALEAGNRSVAATLEVEQWLVGPTRDLADLDRTLVDTMRSMILASYDLDKGGEEQGPDPLPFDRVEEVRARTLVVSGSLDIPEMIAIAELLSQRLDDASLVRLPDTAHLPPFEVPDTLARIVLEFLAA